MNSLRLRLVLLLSIALSIAWLVAAWFTYAESREEVNRLFDTQLAQSAQVLLGTTSHELHERVEHDDKEISITEEYEQKLIFQIWNENTLLLHSAAAPTNRMASDKAGFSETKIGENLLRVFTRWDTRHEFMVQVAEPLAAREALARHITLKMLVPTLIALPFLAILLWFGIGAGLQPLHRLKQEVKQRAARQLQPMTMSNVPEEVAPLVQSLNDLFARLTQTFENERRFTADAAHELRTPLAALKIQAQVAQRTQDTGKRNIALANLLTGVDRATHLIEQLLTLARVDPEHAAEAFKPVDLRRLAVNTMADLAPMAQAKHITLNLVASDLEASKFYTVNGIEAQLGILLRNLIDNAIRYTISGGVTIALHNSSGMTLEVSDTGPGIEDGEHAQVQQRFYRVSASGEQGSGLGLSIVKRIAELHGAKLDFGQATLGRGLKVSVHWQDA
ncbi:MAG: ATP-binding protein [Methylophilaceae bacterium]